MSRPERALNPTRSALDRFGYELRRVRKMRGLSQDRLGLLVHVSGDLIQRIEVGARRPSRDLAERCDAALCAQGALTDAWDAFQAEHLRPADAVLTDNSDRVTDKESPITDKPSHSVADRVVSGRMILPAVAEGSEGLFLAPGANADEEGQADGFSAADDEIVPCRAEDGRIIWVSVPRRNFLAGGAGIAASLVAGPPLAHGRSAAKLMARLRSSAGSPFDRFEAMRKVLRDCDNLFGPTHVIYLAHEQLVMLDGLRKNTRGQDNERLLDIEVQFADLLAWLYQDSGNHHNAQYWLSRALDLTHISGNSGTVSFILARKSQLAGQFKDGAEAVEVAEAATRGVSARSRSAAISTTYAAHGHALRRERALSLHTYDRAHELLESAELEETAWYGQFLNSSYIDIQRAHSLSVLEDYDQATEVFRQAINAMPDSYYRDRGVYLARKALAHAGAASAGQGDAEEHAASACKSGLEALAIGIETSSGRIRTELAQLERGLKDWRELPAVDEFRDALNSVSALAANHGNAQDANGE